MNRIENRVRKSVEALLQNIQIDLTKSGKHYMRLCDFFIVTSS
jgi:hypothetical protein